MKNNRESRCAGIMSQVRKCYNENCENNYMGAYCECCEITIDENGYCCSYFPKQEEEKEKNEKGGEQSD